MKRKIAVILSCIMIIGALPAAYAKEAAYTAVPTKQDVMVSGSPVDFASYNIDGYNYFRIRDIVAAFNWSPKNFNVEYNAERNSVDIFTYTGYSQGIEAISKYEKSGNQVAIPTHQEVYVDGREVTLEAYAILGYNYCKLRDLAELIDFAVDWNATDKIVSIHPDFDFAFSQDYEIPVVVYPEHTGTITTQMAIDDIISIIGPGGPEHWVIEGHYAEHDWQQLITDPYSSPVLSEDFDMYKEHKDFQSFIVYITYWIAGGGDDRDTAAKGEIFG